MPQSSHLQKCSWKPRHHVSCCCVAPSLEVEPLQLQSSVPTLLTVSRKGPAALSGGPAAQPTSKMSARIPVQKSEQGPGNTKPWKSTPATPRSGSRPLTMSWLLLLTRTYCSGLQCLNNFFVTHVILYCTLSPQIVTTVLCAPGVLTSPFSVTAPHDTGTQ